MAAGEGSALLVLYDVVALSVLVRMKPSAA